MGFRFRPFALVLPLALLTQVGGVSHGAAEDGAKKPGFFSKVKGVIGLGKKEEPAPPPVEEPPKPAPKPTPKKSSSTTAKSKAKAPQVKKTTPKAAPKPKPKVVAPKPDAPKAEEPKPETAKQNTPRAAVSGSEKKTEVPKAGEAVVPAPMPLADAPATVAKRALPPIPPPPPPGATSLPKWTPPVVTSPTAPIAVEEKPAEKPPVAKAAAPTGKAMSLDSEFATIEKEEPAPKAPTQAAAPAPKPPPMPIAGGTWQIFQHEGHDWVAFESIHAFYGFSQLKVSGEHVWLVNPTMMIKTRVGSQEVLINNVKFILSHECTRISGKVCISRVDLAKLLDPVIRPDRITQSEPFETVILDAGHGGHDSGAKGIYGYEKDYTLQLAAVTRQALLKRGFKVVMTRQDDRFISLGGRAQFANAIPKSIFISLHFNSSGSATASGIETFALTPQGSSSTAMGAREWDVRSFTGNLRDAENIALATAVHAMVLHRFKLVDRGIKRARWSVLTGCTRPGILFEGGFVTNDGDGRLIASRQYQEQIASAIGDAMLNYKAALHPKTAQRKR